MAKQKKQLTIKQQAKRYRNLKVGLKISEFLAFFAPFITIAIVNKDKYFVQYEGEKVSLGFILAMIVMGVGLVGVMTQKVKNTYLIFIVKWITFAAAFTFLGQVITDLAMIMWYGLIGLVGSFLLDLGANAADKKYKDKLNSIQVAKKNKEVEQAGNEI